MGLGPYFQAKTWSTGVIIRRPWALEKGMTEFSAAALVSTRRGKATLTYWGLAQSPGRGVCLAQSDDKHLDRWTKSPANPVIRSTHWGYTVEKNENGEQMVYGSADPSNIWIKDGRYYMLTGNLLVLEEYGQKQKEGRAPRGTRPNLMVFRRPEDVEVPSPVLPVEARVDPRRGRLHVSVVSPAALEPRWRTRKREAPAVVHQPLSGLPVLYRDVRKRPIYPGKNTGRMSWVDRTYFAPEALIDDQGTPDHVGLASGRLGPVVSKNPAAWSGVYGLPRTLWLGEDGNPSNAPG